MKRALCCTALAAALLGACERTAAPDEAAPSTAAPAHESTATAVTAPADTAPTDRALVARIDAALARAAAFLRRAQRADGSFRSELYPAFRDGYSLSPLALTVLRVVPGDHGDALARGVAFTATLVQDGALRADAAAPQYPLYAVAGALLVLAAEPGARHDTEREILQRALEARQLDAARGYRPAHPSFGGFSYDSALSVPHYDGAPADRDNAANLSATLFAIGALRLGGAGPDLPALQHAREFVLRCQNIADRPDRADPRFDDGGFFFSPAIDDPNKAGAAGRDRRGRLRQRSYGSMTADGVRALLQLGLPPDAPRVRAAAAWLERHFDAEQNPGAFPVGAEVRRASAYYYYAWSVAHALRALGKSALQTDRGTVQWPQALATALLARQSEDGAFRNRSSELREDDPLVATPFASAALANARIALTGEHRSHRR